LPGIVTNSNERTLIDGAGRFKVYYDNVVIRTR
jgi:hypothetical protein